jgi:hypothetical protein
VTALRIECRVAGVPPVERLMCHPRLPLVAVLESQRPAVHVWECAGGRLREVGTLGAGSKSYSVDRLFRTWEQVPAVAWHPNQPLLAMSVGGQLSQWTPAGGSDLEGVPTGAAYRFLAYSPDGRALWASPSRFKGERHYWADSDAMDLASGTVTTIPPTWDTGMAVHPSGELVLTYTSDQSGTYVFVARIDSETSAMRVLRRTLVLLDDGFATPVFSADGRYFAIRKDRVSDLTVFEVPSLRAVVHTSFGVPHPSHPTPQAWYDEARSWSPHNVAFAGRPGVLWIGTPRGVLIEIDLDAHRATEHREFASSPITALAKTATGELLAATATGDLTVLSVHTDSDPASDAEKARAGAAEFLTATAGGPNARPVRPALAGPQSPSAVALTCQRRRDRATRLVIRGSTLPRLTHWVNRLPIPHARDARP